MMTRRCDSFVLTLLMAVALMAGCGKGSLLPQLGEDGRGLPQALVLADSLMNSRPDSALAVLEGAEGEMAGEHQRRQWQLRRLNAINKLDTVFTAAHVAHAQTLANYFDRHGTANEQMLVHYLLGRTYADAGEAPRAIEAYNEAAEHADTTALDCDYHTLCRVHAQKAELYYSQLLPDNMIREERLAIKYALMDKDTMTSIACNTMLGEGYDMKGMLDSALIILTESYQLYNKMDTKQLAAELCCSMADICRRQRGYAQAEKYMQEFETQSGYFNKRGDIKPGKEMYYSCKGHLCLNTSDKDKAEYYFRKLLGVSNNYSLKSAAFVGLRQFYANYFDKDSLIKYNNLCDSLAKIVHIEAEMQKTLQVQAMYDYTRSELIASQKSREADKLRYILIIVASLCIIAVLFFVIVYIRHQNTQRLLQSKYQAEMEKLAQAQADLLALQSEQSISQKLLSQKEQEIVNLQNTTEQYRHKIHTLQGYALNERLQQAPVTIRLQQYLKHDPYQLPTFEDWRDLKILINHEIPSFYDTLNAETNKLNDFEYDVCVLLRLQFSPANIAKLKKCTPAYITQIRRAVYKKIFQNEGRADDLDEYILSLS